ncbi:MAG: hypothetical protein ACLFSV_01770 [Alkalispirochaeta sp.]
MIPTVRTAAQIIDSPSPGRRLRRAGELHTDAVSIVRGRVVLFSGSAVLSLAASVARQYQILFEAPLAWIIAGKTIPYPPDLTAAAVELSRVVWISAPDRDDALAAVDTLLRSDAFPLVCLDAPWIDTVPPGLLARFMHRLRRSGNTLLLLTDTVPATPSPAIGYHIVSTERDDGAVSLTVRRARTPLDNDVWYADTAVPLS